MEFISSLPTKNHVSPGGGKPRAYELHVRLAKKFGKPTERCQKLSKIVSISMRIPAKRKEMFLRNVVSAVGLFGNHNTTFLIPNLAD